jgi:DNA-binding NarL/FixJ family response regulator
MILTSIIRIGHYTTIGMGKIQIALWDDNPLYMLAFAEIVDAYGEGRVAVRTDSLPGLLEALASDPPDLIVADSELVEQCLPEVLTRLIACYPHIPILLLGFEPPRQLDLIREAQPRLHYLSKEGPLDTLLNTLVYLTNYSGSEHPEP